MKPPESVNWQSEVPRVASLGQSGGESARLTPQPSPLATEFCVEILHDLNNAFAAVLMNAQVLDGKLPSYSRSKRYIHEIERSAQRGGALLKRLLGRIPADANGCYDKESGSGKVPPVAERTVAVASQGSSAASNSAFDFAPSTAANTTPDFLASAEGGSQHDVIPVLACNSQKGTIEVADS